MRHVRDDRVGALRVAEGGCRAHGVAEEDDAFVRRAELGERLAPPRPVVDRARPRVRGVPAFRGIERVRDGQRRRVRRGGRVEGAAPLRAREAVPA